MKNRNHRQKGIQAKHLDDLQILQYINYVAQTESVVMNWRLYAAINKASVVKIPPKVWRAKLQKMVQKGLIDMGCTCGCGSYVEVITPGWYPPK